MLRVPRHAVFTHIKRGDGLMSVSDARLLLTTCRTVLCARGWGFAPESSDMPRVGSTGFHLEVEDFFIV